MLCKVKIPILLDNKVRNFFIMLSSKKQIKTIVSAVESKKEFSKTTILNITNIGRKGGSSVACSIINALMLLYLHRL